MACPPHSKPSLGLIRLKEQAKQQSLLPSYNENELFSVDNFPPSPGGVNGVPEFVAVMTTDQYLNTFRRKRTNFTEYQLKELEIIFAHSKHITPNARADLAAKLNLREDTIQTWFKNRRMKCRNERRARTGPRFPACSGCMCGATGRHCIPLTTMPRVVQGWPSLNSVPKSSFGTARLPFPYNVFDNQYDLSRR